MKKSKSEVYVDTHGLVFEIRYKKVPDKYTREYRILNGRTDFDRSWTSFDESYQEDWVKATKLDYLLVSNGDDDV